MNIDQAFPSKYVASGELPDQGIAVTIKHIQIEDLQNERGSSRKPVLYFENCTKGMVLNKTNALLIAAQHGKEMDAWIGKTITIYPTQCSMGAEIVPCIRVRGLRTVPLGQGVSIFGNAQNAATQTQQGQQHTTNALPAPTPDPLQGAFNGNGTRVAETVAAGGQRIPF
jgi:hypothetical protein